MKQLIAMIATLTLGQFANASHFTCTTDNVSGKDMIQVVVNHYTKEKTRTAAIMVVSKPNQESDKTVGTFKHSDEQLFNEGAKYYANVDERYTNGKGFKSLVRGGEDLLGTELQSLDTIILDIDFSYDAPAAHCDLMNAYLILNKEDAKIQADGAKQIIEKMTCVYTKKTMSNIACQ